MTDLCMALPRPMTTEAQPSHNIDGRVVSLALLAFVTLSVYLRQVVHWRQASLVGSVFDHTTSVMNVGILLGALMASGLAGRFKPAWTVSGRSLAAAIGGGLLLSYGARLAYGCNIGAYFSGVASGSLHGWLWLVAAFTGSVVGTRLRPMCDMIVERTDTRSA